MNTLNLGSDDEPVVKKKSNTRNLKIALGLAAVILIPTIGSTLAGTITVSGGSVEFGQGVSQTAACGNLTLTPAAGFTNVADGGVFGLGTVTLSAIPVACSAKTFTIKAFDNTAGSSALPLSLRSGSALIVTPTYSGSSCSSITVAAGSGQNETATCTASGGIGTVVITVGSTLASTTIYKFTVESS